MSPEAMQALLAVVEHQRNTALNGVAQIVVERDALAAEVGALRARVAELEALLPKPEAETPAAS